MAAQINRGTTDDTEAACAWDRMLRRRRGQNFSIEECPALLLKGENPVYNFFTINASALSNRTIIVSGPPSSVVLVNVVGSGRFRVRDYNYGIQLDGIVAIHLLWNVVGKIGFQQERERFYTWYGTLMNRRGRVKFTTWLSKRKFSLWKGRGRRSVVRS